MENVKQHFHNGIDSPQIPLLSLEGSIYTETTYDPPSLLGSPNVAQDSKTISVPGAALGDFVIVSFDKDLQGLTLTGYVSSVDTVTTTLVNSTSGSVNLGSGTLKVLVLKKV